MDDRSPLPPSPDAADYGETSPFRPKEPEPLLTRAIPVSGQLSRYRVPSARRDLVAGVTVAALAVPVCDGLRGGGRPLARATACTRCCCRPSRMCCSGSSRQLIIGPEGSISTLVAVAVLPLAAAGSADAAELAAMLALLVAVCFGLAWVLRLGWIADYFSRPVLIGYIHGVAVVLIIGQLGKLLGLSIDARDPLPQLWEVLTRARQRQRPDGRARRGLARRCCSGCASSCPGCPRRSLVVVAAIAVSWALDLQAHGVAVVGAIPAGLPELRRAEPRWRGRRRSSRRRRSASSSSRSPTRFSPRARSPASTTSTCAPPRSCSRWAPRTPRPASPRASRSARAARARRSTTAWARAARSPASSPPPPCS